MERRSNKPVPIVDELAKDSRRYLGDANALAARALKDDAVLRGLVEALGDERRVVVHRAANALKKVQRADAARVRPFGKQILKAIQRVEDLHTRWNLTILLGGLELKGRDRALAMELLFEALGESGLIRALAMQSLMDLAVNDATLRRRMRPVVDVALEDPMASVRARARKLAKLLAL